MHIRLFDIRPDSFLGCLTLGKGILNLHCPHWLGCAYALENQKTYLNPKLPVDDYCLLVITFSITHFEAQPEDCRQHDRLSRDEPYENGAYAL